MPPLTFFFIPFTSLFLLSSLGLVSKEIAGLAFVVKQFNSGFIGGGGYGDGGGDGSSDYSDGSCCDGSYASSGYIWGPYFGPNFSTYTYYLPVTYSATTPPSTPYSLSTGMVARSESSLQGTPTTTSLLARHTVQPTPFPGLNKRQSLYGGSGSYGYDDNPTFQGSSDVSGIKAKTDAALALFSVQLVCIIALLLLTSLFLAKHRKFYKGGSLYQQTSFFHSFHKGFGIASSLYFTSGIVCFAILGSESGSRIGPILAATIALWSITIIALFGLLFALKIDARKSERNEQKTKEEGGDPGRGEAIPVQEQQNHHQSYGQQPVSMLEPHVPH